MAQVAPLSAETKNWARAMRAPFCAPTATISAPSLVMLPSVWLMPRPPGAAVNWLPASVAGGTPSAAGGGAWPAWAPLLASAITTTATPNTIMVTIGTATRMARPRNSRAERNRLNQDGLAGSGVKERSRRVHSVPAPGDSVPALRCDPGLGRDPGL